MFAASKADKLNMLVQGGQLYWAFPFRKSSLAEVTNTQFDLKLI